MNTRKSDQKVLLLNMPYGALDHPALGISLLKTVLTEQHIACDIRYLNFPFAEFIGTDEYNWISLELPYTAFTGDWTFTHLLYGENTKTENRYIQDILREIWHLSDSDILRILSIKNMAYYFLNFCLEAIPWKEYAIVGFTSTFEQNIASLALAKRIKERYSNIVIVFGGANWEAEMGLELHRCFHFVDFVCSGEAEKSFSSLVQSLLFNKSGIKITKIPGIVYRCKGQSIPTGQAEIVCNLDHLPVPDYSDYFNDLSTATISIIPTLLFETSRGCWWGNKSQCLFCGLNGTKLSFRSKSFKRAFEEICYLADKWQTTFLEAVDNILDMRYFSDLLPALANAKKPLQLFYEVKANLDREHVKILKEAGVTQIQPGIESLNDNILKLMRKGTTTLKNIQLLKWCKEFNINVYWNIIYGFPGEKKDDYDAMLKLLPAISFLDPPIAYGPVRLDRFSPYFNNSDQYGFTNVRPLKVYNYIYPFSAETVNRIAYSFDYDYKSRANPISYVSQLIDYIETWKGKLEKGVLYSTKRSYDTLILIDERPDAFQPEFKLLGIERAVYEFCEEIRNVKQIMQKLNDLFPDRKIAEEQLVEILDMFINYRLMITDGKNYLSLAIPQHPVLTHLETIEINKSFNITLEDRCLQSSFDATVPMVI